MKTLLQFFVEHFSFLYLDPRYRITDSGTSGVATIDAGLTLTGPLLSWSLANNRGRIGFAVAPTQFAKSPDNWFRLTVIRQYLDGFDEANAVSPEATAAWISDNLGRIEELFSDESVAGACAALIDLEESLATKYFGPPNA